MFSRLNRTYRKKQQKRRRQNVSRRNRLFGQGRMLSLETLESRQMLTLLGVAPLDLPTVAYDSNGTINYDSIGDQFSLNATPLSIATTTNPSGLFFSGSVDINIEVDDTGSLVGGTAGDDFVLSGDVDLNGDFIVDASGVLLTGEVQGFGQQDSGGTTDNYDFRFAVTGGLLAGDFAGKDIGITTTSENSTFTGDFTVDFGGKAKGNIGAIVPIPSNPAIDIEKFTNGVDADNLADAPEIAPGSPVTFTYLVTNTGDVAFDFADVEVVDDNGTPTDLSDDVSTTSGDIVLLPASDVGGDLILSAGEVWQYEYTTTAVDVSLGGLSDLVPDGTYQLGNHPDGNAGPPLYGLRLDGLTTGDASDIFTFSFDQTDGADLKMIVDGNTVTIEGTVFGGRVVSHAYVPAESGLWNVSFAYNNVLLATGDDDLGVDAADTGMNTGSITKLFGDGATFDLVDYAGGNATTFNLGNEADDLGHRGFDGISGWGWLNHAPSTDPAWLNTHLPASDWLFTADRIDTPFYKNTAVVTAPGATDMDMSHYTNPDGPVTPPDAPHISYNSDGTINYDSATDILTLDATPISITTTTTPFGLFFDGDFDINIVVDDTGSLVSGIAGDDFVLVGDVDTDGDFIVDLSGVLLTGEIIDFSATDSGGITDNYEFRFDVTGGLLAPQYAGNDLLIMTTSENSTFTGDFTVNFGGNAKGNLWPVASVADLKGSIGNYVFIDNDSNGLQNTGDQGINGITVNLLDEQGNVLASTVTDFDASGNAGFYLFFNLDAGNYVVEFEVPDGVVFTTQDAGDDTLDSDVNVTTKQTDVITLADGEHRRDIDAGVKATVMVDATVYQIQNYVNYYQNRRAGKIKSLDIEYSDGLDELYVSIEFAAYRGRLTDGFTFVLTGGQWPAGTQDKFALFYFDADVHHRNGGPVLNVFGYNGLYNAKSFRDSNGVASTYDPDLIATSKDNSSGWVKDLNVQTHRVNGRWRRTMSFRIVASTVNSHVPLQGTDWSGAQMGSMASFSIDTYDGLYTKYKANGFLKKWRYRRHGWMDGDWVATTEVKVWQETPIQDFLQEFNWVVTDYVNGTSDGDPPLDANDTVSDLDWAGSVDAVMEELLIL